MSTGQWFPWMFDAGSQVPDGEHYQNHICLVSALRNSGSSVSFFPLFVSFFCVSDLAGSDPRSLSWDGLAQDQGGPFLAKKTRLIQGQLGICICLCVGLQLFPRNSAVVGMLATP